MLNDITGNGGVERVVTNLSNSFSEKLGYQVDIISAFTAKNKIPYLSINPNINIIYLQGKKSKSRVFKYLEITKTLFNLTKKENYDVVISTSVTLTILLLLNRIINQSFAIVSWEQTQYDNIPIYFKLIMKFIYKYVNLIITLTNHDREIFEKYNENSSCIYNYISNTERKKSLLESHKILAIGRLEKEKSFDSLIRAFVYVKKLHPTWYLDIYGEGSEKKRLEKLITELKLKDRVILKGFKENIEDIYPDYTQFVLSSKSESFGMVLLEAMSYGLACVSNDCKIGPIEIINDEVDGLLARTGDINHLASQMIRVIENKKLRETLAINAIEKSKLFYEDKIIQQWDYSLNKYQKVIK